jgi:hypothetical protein
MRYENKSNQLANVRNLYRFVVIYLFPHTSFDAIEQRSVKRQKLSSNDERQLLERRTPSTLSQIQSRPA